MSAALLIGPFLESIGLTSFIAGGAAEIAGSAAIGELVGAGAVGAIAGEAGKKIDEAVLSRIPDSIKNGPKKIYNDYKAAAMSLYAQDPRYLIENKRKQQAQQPQAPNSQTRYVQETKNNGVINTSQEIIKQEQNNTSLAYTALYNQLSTETAITFEPTEDSYDPFSAVVPADLETEIEDYSQEYFESRVYEEAYDKYLYSPRDIARYLIDYSRDLAITRDPVKTLSNILQINPSYYGLSKRITSYLAEKSLPNTEEFQKISSIYNFSNITYDNFKIFRNEKNLIEVEFTDEVGNIHSLEQNTGIILPCVSADLVFMGPHSRNNELPNQFRLEDWASMDHDWFYAKEGYFSHEGDLRFISRLAACLKNGRILPENRQLVESTIIYFSNISLTLGQFKSQNSTIEKTDTNAYVDTEGSPEESNDIFEEFGSPEALEMPPVEDYEYVALRDNFYETFMNEMVEYNKTDGYMTYSKNNYVENQLNDIFVQIN